MNENIITCPNPFKDEYYNNCLGTHKSYAPIELVENTLCVKCANRYINRLNNLFLFFDKPNLKVGSKLKCINPIFDLELNKKYLCSDFGFKTIIVDGKNYVKKRFLVKDNGWKEINSSIGRGLEGRVIWN